MLLSNIPLDEQVARLANRVSELYLARPIDQATRGAMEADAASTATTATSALTALSADFATTADLLTQEGQHDAIPVATAGTSYGTNEQDMLQVAYDVGRLLLTAMRNKGAIVDEP